MYLFNSLYFFLKIKSYPTNIMNAKVCKDGYIIITIAKKVLVYCNTLARSVRLLHKYFVYMYIKMFITLSRKYDWTDLN